MSDNSDKCLKGSDDEPPQTGPAGLISVDVLLNGGDWTALPEAVDAVREAAGAAARMSETRLAGANVAIALAADADVAALNEAYRGKSASTNVLSFPAPQLPAGVDTGECFLGDIILAAETVTREAADLQIPLRHHLQHLVVHGLLHLSGFDHDTDEAAHSMETLETRILATLEIPDPYARISATADV